MHCEVAEHFCYLIGAHHAGRYQPMRPFATTRRTRKIEALQAGHMLGEKKSGTRPPNHRFDRSDLKAVYRFGLLLADMRP